ncbi:Por secretion system C-terminal sorting domain-containing protein [Flavobacterium sp. 9AF]|uniref:T9SS type A sorting domain-containing protein n=1 Tax=Flavobacterium sp. 9AF TaxID=2653142 RepID=UPI0012F466DF|nr:T9SS type A sorting domain-containing protein [Flavobacterium sp. 9AF]VXA94622.1 Por secretion system C-terminal sorting domain-containing protein [Flavobacterium sp. 9AF]
MKKFLLCFILSISFNFYSQTPSFEWAHHFGNTAAILVYDNITDASGNVYITGEYSGTIDFDPGSGTAMQTSNGSGNDIFILKLSASGSYVWVKTYGGTGIDLGQRLAVDNAGNVYVGGRFQNSFSFGSLGTVSSGGGYDGFLLKMDTNGNPLWFRTAVSSGNDFFTGVDVDSSGNVYACGSYTQALTLGSGYSWGISASGTYDYFVAKFDSNGTILYAYPFGNGYDDIAYNLKLSNDESRFAVCGEFRASVDFDPSSSNYTLFSLNGSYTSAFVQVLNASYGYLIYAKRFGSTSSANQAFELAFDSQNNIHIVGRFAGSTGYFDYPSNPASSYLANSNGGSGFDGYVVKYNANGAFVWVKSFQGIGSGTNEQATCVSVDVSDNVYVAGTFNSFGGMDLDPSSTTVSAPNYGSTSGTSDIFLVSLNSAGNYLWGYSYTNSNNNDNIWALTVDSNYNLIASGYFNSTQIDIDPLSSAGNQLITGNTNGSNDIFITKLSQATLMNDNFAKNEGIIYYPNPVKDIFIFESNEEIASVELFTLSGSKINTEIRNNSIDISHLQSGMYIVKAITFDGKQFTNKIIKK